MRDISTALESLARFKVQFQGLADLAEDLSELQSLEGVAAAAEKRRDDAEAKLAALKDESDKAAADLKDAQDYADKLMADAEAKAKARAEQAQADADVVIAKAKADAANAAQDTITRFKLDIDSLTTQKTALEEEVAQLTELRKSEQERRGQIERDVLELGAQLAQVRSAIASLRQV